jgi:DNA ligase-1
MQHGKNWSGQDVVGWWGSEKLDGVRGFWDGCEMWTRSGRKIQIPKHWQEGLPAMRLDGEIWAGRGGLRLAVNATNYGHWTTGIGYFVFDAPDIVGAWPDRLASAKAAISGDFCAVVPCRKIKDITDAATWLGEVHSKGGEGLMFHFPRSRYYRVGRVAHLLKLKKQPHPHKQRETGVCITLGRIRPPAELAI